MLYSQLFSLNLLILTLDLVRGFLERSGWPMVSWDAISSLLIFFFSGNSNPFAFYFLSSSQNFWYTDDTTLIVFYWSGFVLLKWFVFGISVGCGTGQEESCVTVYTLVWNLSCNRILISTFIGIKHFLVPIYFLLPSLILQPSFACWNYLII